MLEFVKKFFFVLLIIASIALLCAIAFLVSSSWQVNAAAPVPHSASTAAELNEILDGNDINIEINYTGADITTPIVIPSGKTVVINGLSMMRTSSTDALITVSAGASLTLCRSKLDGNAIAADVAAILVFDSLTVGEDTSFINCVSTGYGAAIYAASNGSVTILSGASVTGRALYGDAIYLEPTSEQ